MVTRNEVFNGTVAPRRPRVVGGLGGPTYRLGTDTPLASVVGWREPLTMVLLRAGQVAGDVVVRAPTRAHLMKDSTLPYWLTLLVVVASAYAFWAMRNDRDAGKSFGSRSVEESPDQPLPRPLPAEFELTDHRGQLLRSKDLHGKVWVASFFFISCPHECVRQNLKIKELVERYGPQGVKFVSITCDPERDTPLKLAEYADRFGADDQRWLFLTGNLSYIQQVGDDILKVSVTPNTHSQKLILVDRAGKVHGYFHWNDSEQMTLFHREVDKLLAESSADPALNETDPVS